MKTDLPIKSIFRIIFHFPSFNILWSKIFIRVVFMGLVMHSYVNSAFSQNNCPALPKKTWIDTLGYIKTEIPTDPAKANGIWLGQGVVRRTPTEDRSGFIPSNKPTWALAIAHAWNLSRNLVQRVEYPKIGYWMGTLVQESELACVPGTTWDAPFKWPNAYKISFATGEATATMLMNHTGAYQIEGPGSAYGALNQAFPYRFPLAKYSTFCEGVNNMETSSLVKVYYDIYTSQIFNYNMGWDFYKNIDCKDQYDPYAYEKMSASGYNGGPNAFLSALPILNNTGNSCWTGLPATTGGYANDVAKWVSVFENNPTYCEYPAGSTFDSYYNANISWTIVNDYLNIIAVMYPEINFATQVAPKVQAAFIAKAGSLAATIPFQQLGSVIDAIILALPLERPTAIEGSPSGVNLSCSGSILPFGHIEILDGSTTMCLGNSVTLELVVDDGGGTSPTYKWYKNSVTPANLIGTDKNITITPTATGEFIYAAQICNGSGCYTLYSNSVNACQDSRNTNGFKVRVNDCSSCSFTASATAVNTPCKGMNKGQINLTLTNTPANYKVTYTANTPIGPVSGTFNSTGNTVSISDVRDGSYNIVLEDLSTPTCKAYTNVIVNYTTLVNEYIDAVKSPQLPDACTATITSTLKELPAPCNWKVRAYNPVDYDWESAVSFGVNTTTGIATSGRHNTILAVNNACVGCINQWNNVYMNETTYTLNTGDALDLRFVLNTPLASQNRGYRVEIYDENNLLKQTYNAPIGSAKPDLPFTAGTYTVTCPTPAMPAYTYAWSPALTTMTNTATTSNGTVNITFGTSRVYTVTATHPTNSQCKLTDTVIVIPTCPTSLPVDLIYFNATAINKNVELNWVASGEYDCKEYVIERSQDGITFDVLATVSCRNTSDLKRYSYTDEFPFSGTSYYRLVQYDMDGKFYHSEIRQVNVEELIISISPNPFNSNVNIALHGTSKSLIEIKVVDIQGKEVYRNHLNGDTKFSIGNEFIPGVYFLQIADQWEVKSYKIVKQ